MIQYSNNTIMQYSHITIIQSDNICRSICNKYVEKNFILNHDFLCSDVFKKKIRYISGITYGSKVAVDEIIKSMISLDNLISEELKK